MLDGMLQKKQKRTGKTMRPFEIPQFKIKFLIRFTRNIDTTTSYIAHRELTYIDGKAFVRADINVLLRDPISNFKTYFVDFDINEIHSYGEQSMFHLMSDSIVYY